MMTDEVAAYINYFSGRGRGILERGLVRSGRYQEMIRRTLKEEGVPQDLIYLAQAESGFHPLALSRVGARGMWQFMASRGAGYGLQRTKWIDDRQDPEKATRAAARHLKDLYNQFGDWYLAMAAYNSGPGTVQSAVKRTGYADFWELYKRNVLPKETRNYVPIILAVTIMAKNPTQYGLNDLVPDKPLPYDSVKIDYPVDLRLVAQCVDATPGRHSGLEPQPSPLDNPGDRANSTSGCPRAPRTSTSRPSPPSRRRCASGGDITRFSPETLSPPLRRPTAARRRQSSAPTNSRRIPNWRPTPSWSSPLLAGRHATTEDAQAYSRRFTRYTVHHGDTADTVADRFGVPTTWSAAGMG